MAGIIHLSSDLGRAFIGFPVPLCAGAFALAVGLDARTTHAIPRSLAVAAVIVGIVELVSGSFFFPLLLFPIWVAAVSVSLLLPPRPAPRLAAAAQASAAP
jgi:hypothetical protein